MPGRLLLGSGTLQAVQGGQWAPGEGRYLERTWGSLFLEQTGEPHAGRISRTHFGTLGIQAKVFGLSWVAIGTSKRFGLRKMVAEHEILKESSFVW